ncbi:MAG: chemotaxis protein CheW [Oligoflexia bacterium]|nr:chemotaxis protein CheW [Oligoflexia bacterium]
MSDHDVVKKASAESHADIFGSFYLDKTEFALHVGHVQEVVNFPGALTPMPLAPDFLVGVFNLRGAIIPVIDLKRLLKFENPVRSESAKIAIVESQGSRVGLIFDSTSEILRPRNEEKVEFQYDDRSVKVVKGMLKLGGGKRLIQILDPEMLVKIENVPQMAAYREQVDRRKERLSASHSLRKKCITFCVCGMKMSFEIKDIHEIVRVPELQHSPLASELCLGMIHVRDQVVPVISFAKLFRGASPEKSEDQDRRIIVLKVEQKLFGLMVDSVESIDSYEVDAIMAIPLLSKERVRMFKGCVAIPQRGDVFLLDHEEVLSREEVLEITRGHGKLFKTKDAENDSAAVRRGGNRDAYLVFRLKHLFGIPIREVKEIIDCSTEIMAMPGVPGFVKGVINLRGKLVTVVDTRGLYQLEATEDVSAQDRKILVFQDGENQFGLIVDSVESIVSVGAESKLKLPDVFTNGVGQAVRQDVREVLEIKMADDRASTLIVLDVAPLIGRIKEEKAA